MPFVNDSEQSTVYVLDDDPAEATNIVIGNCIGLLLALTYAEIHSGLSTTYSYDTEQTSTYSLDTKPS